MYHVYILYSHTCGKRYVGQTDDLDRRICQHNDPNYTGAGCVDSNRRPGGRPSRVSWRYQWNRLYKSARVTVLPYCKGVAITPEGKMLVTDSNGLHEVDDSGEKHELISWTLQDPWSYFSPDGRWVAAKFESGIELYHIKSRKKVLSLPQGRCSISSNGAYFAAWKLGAMVDSLSPDEDAIPVWKLEPDGTVTSVDPLEIGETKQLPTGGTALKMGNDGKSSILRVSPGQLHPNEIGRFWTATLIH